MRRVLFSILCLSLLAGCSLVESVQKFGPYRVNVQQGNALDAENIARLKLGLSRSQVRFLLGTPLVIDPFRNDRWDYVYLYYEAGTLLEQKRISLFFEGDTLSRIEGDVPASVLTDQSAANPVSSPSAEIKPLPAPEPVSATPDSPRTEPVVAPASEVKGVQP